MTQREAFNASDYQIPQHAVSETPIYDELKTYYQSVEQRRGYITFDESLSRVNDASKQITELRERYLVQKKLQNTPIFRTVMEQTVGRIGFLPYEPRMVSEDDRKALGNAESECGATIFGEPPEGQYWTFHQEIAEGKYEWRLLMFYNDAEEPFNTLAYRIGPNRYGGQEIYKRHISSTGDVSRRLEPTSGEDTEELITLAFAAEKYLALIPPKLYRERQPRHLSSK